MVIHGKISINLLAIFIQYFLTFGFNIFTQCVCSLTHFTGKKKKQLVKYSNKKVLFFCIYFIIWH